MCLCECMLVCVSVTRSQKQIFHQGICHILYVSIDLGYVSQLVVNTSLQKFCLVNSTCTAIPVSVLVMT